MNAKLNPVSTKKRNVINIGTSLMVVILMGMAFAVISALALSSSKNNLNLSERQKQHTTEYYLACSKAYEAIDEAGWSDQEFDISINDYQKLTVKVEEGNISCFKVVNTSEWSADESLPVFIGE